MAMYKRGDKVELYPPVSASDPDIHLRGTRATVKDIRHGLNPEAESHPTPLPGEQVPTFNADIWLYQLDLEGNLGERWFRQDWLKAPQTT